MDQGGFKSVNAEPTRPTNSPLAVGFKPVNAVAENNNAEQNDDSDSDVPLAEKRSSLVGFKPAVENGNAEKSDDESDIEPLSVKQCKRKRTMISSVAEDDFSIPSPKRLETEQSNLIGTTTRMPKEKSLRDIRGVLLGFWKDSDALQDDDKHAAYGVVDAGGSRMRIKVLKFTRDGRPSRGNWPEKQGAEWISFEGVVLEPALAKLTRTEIKEYARLRGIERQKGDSSAGIDFMVVEKARSNTAIAAQMRNISVAQLNALTEIGRKANVERRKKARAIGLVDSLKEALDDDGGREGVAPITTPGDTQPKAIRSSKAESDARAERLKRAQDKANIEDGKAADGREALRTKECRVAKGQTEDAAIKAQAEEPTHGRHAISQPVKDGIAASNAECELSPLGPIFNGMRALAAEIQCDAEKEELILEAADIAVHRLEILRGILDDPRSHLYKDRQWHDVLSAVESYFAASHAVPDKLMTEWHHVRAAKTLKLEKIAVMKRSLEKISGTSHL